MKTHDRTTATRYVYAALLVFVLGTSSADAQQPRRIAWLGSGSESGSAVFVSAFKQGLKENGSSRAGDYVFDAVYADNIYKRFPALVQEQIERDPAVIVAVTIASVRAAQRATTTVPIVMISTNDPVGVGLIVSRAPRRQHHSADKIMEYGIVAAGRVNGSPGRV